MCFVFLSLFILSLSICIAFFIGIKHTDARYTFFFLFLTCGSYEQFIEETTQEHYKTRAKQLDNTVRYKSQGESGPSYILKYMNFFELEISAVNLIHDLHSWAI